MADIVRFGKCLTVFGVTNLFLPLLISCQYQSVHHPVSFVQRMGEAPTMHILPRNPYWNQNSMLRKRSPDSLQRPYYGPSQYNQQLTYYNNQPYNQIPNQIPQTYPHYDTRSSVDLIHSETRDGIPNDGRLLSDSAFTRISETLGAINTVGHYLVDIVNENERNESNPNLQQLPQALYTLSKNVLGRNVTDKIAPIVKKALPKVLPDAPITKIATGDVNQENDAKYCTTPEGEAGVCEDLSNCPQLLLNLINLRESLCFKDLFVPGVCCPRDAVIPSITAVEKPVVATTSKPTYLLPVTSQKPVTKPTTTKRPSAVLVLTTKKPKPPTTTRPTTTSAAPVTTSRPVSTTSFYTELPPSVANYSNIVDASECGQREDEGGRIVGGTEAKSGAWPWMAAIYLHGSKRREFWCGGTLVDRRHVLTAAHCTRDSKQRPFPARQFSVRLGDVDLGRDDEPSRPVTLRVTAVRAHEQFSRVGFYNDIAILVLSENVQKSKYVIPICLPRGEVARQQFDGAMATVVGWGTTRYGGTESSRQLEARMPVWRNEDCDRAYFQPITDTFLCAGYTRGGVDACQGDSGGPLMLQANGRWTQIGVVSFGNKCGEPGYPGVYTRVTRYLSWLQQNIT
ncbi:PREDICTED: proclotting enzyme-like isoform X1 [Papilio polytes]|uniref:proclotting enzyme-like isoform X1 n=2 Tax=Papilio polytes TaxID=76194 RepID=UPI000675BF23|nr:PREDICTED: proclotting enzyme-like isoform X1 [Papilio polytes]